MTADARMALAEAVLARSRADATEVTVESKQQALTRFTHESVHQNIDEAGVTIQVRAIVDGRSGMAVTNARDEDALAAVAERAREIATFAPRETIEPTVADAADVTAPAGAYVAATAAAGAGARAQIAGAMFAQARAAGLWSAGYVTTSAEGITIATSRGARLHFDGTDCGANVKMNGTDATGFAERYANDVGVLDGLATGARAAAKAVAARAPAAVDPAEWAVIMEPAAFGELLAYFRVHFSAESYSDGSSFVAGQLGRRVAGDNVTIRDDYAHPLDPGMPFDYDGVPKQRLTLLERGVVRQLATDAEWSKRLNCPNTGHALPRRSGWPSGPQSLNTVVEPGTKTVDQLIAETKRGILISRLWYVRHVDQRKSIVTGMTRDGTFLIEDGALSRGVRNMRFNVSIGELLNACELAADQFRTGGYSYSIVTPSVKFERFRFASVSPY